MIDLRGGLCWWWLENDFQFLVHDEKLKSNVKEKLLVVSILRVNKSLSVCVWGGGGGVKGR